MGSGPGRSAEPSPGTGGRAPGWIPWVLAMACLLPRLPGLGLPLLEEGHAWRQSVTAMMARNFHRHGYRLLWPEIDLPPKHRPAGTPSYTNAEFPLYPWLVSLGYGLAGVREWIGRLLSVACAVGTTALLYRLVGRLYGAWAGTVAAAFWLLNPMGVFYTRAFLPEPLMVFLAVLALERLTLWLEGGSDSAYWVGLVAATLAPMVKQPALHLLLPLGVVAWLAPTHRGGWRRGLLLAVPLVATVAWYRWAQWLGARYAGHFAVGGGSGLINWNLWLRGDANFYPRFTIVMVVLVGAVTGWLVALCGLHRPRGAQAVMAAWLLAALAVAMVAGGATITHFYYNLALLPPLAALIGHGAGRWPSPRLRWYATLIVLLGPPLVLGFGQVQSWYEIRGGEVAAAAAARRVIPREELVYTICYGTQLLYACDRRGEFLLADPEFLDPRYVQEAEAAGMSWLVTGRRELLESPAGGRLGDYLARKRLAAAGAGYLVYDLKQARGEPAAPRRDSRE